jgi:hypothetical protein
MSLRTSATIHGLVVSVLAACTINGKPVTFGSSSSSSSAPKTTEASAPGKDAPPSKGGGDATVRGRPSKERRPEPTSEDPAAPTIKSLEAFSNFGGNNVEIPDGCNAGVAVEVDETSYKLGYRAISSADGENLRGYDNFTAGHDFIETCMNVYWAMERLCKAHPEQVRSSVKTIRCTLVDAKPVGSHVPRQAFADGTWSVAYSWWATSRDVWGLEDTLAKSLGISKPKREAFGKFTPAPPCSKQSDCRGNMTCWAAIEHGPRCLPPEAFADAGGGDDGGSDAEPTDTKGSTKKAKKPEGSYCNNTSECESKAGMRCAQPRPSGGGRPASSVKRQCLTSGY